MIFYFSGTGNSLYVAKKIASLQNETLISISEEVLIEKEAYEYELKPNEKVIFVFPIYAWAPPSIVDDFIRKLKLNHYHNHYVTAIATCGENVGNVMKRLSNQLKKKQITLHSGFSVVMPNNYVIYGSASTKEESMKIIEEAEPILQQINQLITKETTDTFVVEKGTFPTLLTNVIHPMFLKFAIHPNRFHVNENCTGCGICEKVCNTKCIKIDKVPTWRGKCTQCLACLNYCPTNAIHYGKTTIGKEQYTNPYIKAKEMMIER